jgi:amino acid adenylation domain-containing protein
MSHISPSMSDLSPEEKRRLLASLLKGKADAAAAPLSYGQRSWWFLHNLDTESASCNVAFAARISSNIDVAALRQAFQALVDRHASLRTTYTGKDDKLLQVVHARRKVHFDQVDASSWGWDDLFRRLVEDSQLPFNLERGPALRVSLYTQSPTSHLLLLMAHHIAIDLWSLMVLLRELHEIYPAAQKEAPPPLVPLQVQYTDYVKWQADLLASVAGERLWAYWQQKLSGELAPLELPSIRPNQQNLSHRRQTHAFKISAKLAQEFKKLSQEHGVTLYMTLLAAFKMLLYRYTAQEDILVGTLAASGRNRAEMSNLVGFLDNPLVLRTRVSGEMSFPSFVKSVSQTVLDAFEHQDYPFALLVERLHPVRQAGRAPLFQVMFIMQRTQLPETAALLALAHGEANARMNLGGLSLESVNLQEHMTTGIAGNLDLTLAIAEIEDRLLASMQFNAGMFDEAMIARMASHFQTFLEGIVAQPERRISRFPLLSPQEKDQLLVVWNDTATRFTQTHLLHKLFEEQAEYMPDAPAAIFAGKSLGYRELNRRANQLAHGLRRRGVGPGVVVGVCVERSLEMIIGLLGILKAGGVYLPLDPAYPKERLDFMLEDARALLVLSQEKIVEGFPERKYEVICLDSGETFMTESGENLDGDTTSADFAYVIYTSGSTGRPKGVMIDHRGAANTIIDVNRRFNVAAGDRVLALSSLSFDLSVYDIFGTLAAGAAIVIPEPSPTPNPAHWEDLMRRERVTMWNSAPALMELFVNSLADKMSISFPSLRLVLLSGDWIPVTLPDEVRAFAENTRVISLGGATEASIWSILYPIAEVDPAWRSIPYGRPMANQRFHALDSELQPLPVGVIGRLHIGGIGVAQGYLNRPDLTAEKFIPDPFGGEPGGRLYHTGDIGRYLPDGNIEFLGRMDQQVKIHGFRIEIGEIEAVLNQHPAIREGVVVAQRNAQGEKRLTAYVVPNQETAFALTEAGGANVSESPLNWEGLLRAGRAYTQRPFPEHHTLDFPLLTRHLDRLTTAYVCRAFRALGVFTRTGEEHTVEELFHNLKVVSRYKKALRRWLYLLVEEGMLEKRGESLVNPRPLPSPPLAALWDEFKQRFSDAQVSETIDYFQLCGENLASVLTGRLHPTQLLFREGASRVAENFYQEVFRYCNAVAREVAAAGARSLPPGGRLRVLEIGAGVGSTTAWLLPVLPPDQTDFTYTDISRYFLDVGKSNFADYPFINYSLLDIEKPPQEQGYEPHSYDIIVASSVLHATLDVKQTVRHARSLLCPRGVLLLIEETRFHQWFNVVGLQEGFDRFEDEDLRQSHPMLTTEQWEAALRAQGFENFGAFNESGSPSDFLGLNVMIAQASSSIIAPLALQLRNFIKTKLPEYMTPASFVILEAMPLTPNGKVDRRALPAPERAAAASNRTIAPPRTATEATLAQLWRQVLGVEQIGIDDNFFELGDSLLATQAVSKLRGLFSVELPLQNFFESPTIAALAERIDAARQSSRVLSPAFESQPPRDNASPLSFAQQRLWFLNELVPGSPFYNVHAAVRLTGELNRPVLERCFQEIVRRHEVLRTSFSREGERPIQIIAVDSPFTVPLIDLKHMGDAEQGAEVQRLATEEAQRPFNLALAPLMRVRLLRLKGNEHMLLLAFHHIIFDGWSLGVLIRELDVLYRDFFNNRELSLPALPIQYADFARWQREWLQGETLEAQLAYWEKQLAGGHVLQLPTDFPRPSAQTFRGSRLAFAHPPDLVDSLKALSSQEGATLFMTLLAAFKTLLYRYTGEKDIVVGSPIANRNRAELDGLIGFFVNALALRTDMSGNPTFRDLLSRVRRTALAAYAHQDLPFEKLVEELRPERNMTHTPLFQIWFVLQNAPLPPLELPGLTLDLLQVDDGTSKFDITLSLFETKQGLMASWTYNTDLFDEGTVARLARHYETLLHSIVADPGAPLNKLQFLTEAERLQQSRAMTDKKRLNLNKLKNVRRQAVDLEQTDLVKIGYLSSSSPMPLVISPLAPSDLDPADWARFNRSDIDRQLLRHGALLFRGFRIDSAQDFERFAQALCPDLFADYGDLPRKPESNHIYHSTPYPPDRPILFHHESSQMHCWPHRIMFYCARPAAEGGATPLADGRLVLGRLRAELRGEFARRGVLYVRNYTGGLDVDWQEFFRTNDRREVEAKCREAGMKWEWLGDDGLRTMKRAAAIIKHPETGEEVFFNQIQAHHVSCLDDGVRESLLSLFGEEGLPRNVYFGDGGRISGEEMKEVEEAYESVAVEFSWERGDVLMVENMLVAHGRRAYRGERKVLVAMGMMFQPGNTQNGNSTTGKTKFHSKRAR